MPRYCLFLEYDGTPFVGWQRQATGISIQGCLEKAIFDLTKEQITIEGAGRTDAGVHACAQVAHFDLSFSFDLCRLQKGLNFYLRPHPIVILKCESVPFDFHARFSACSRSYRYIILNRSSPSVLGHNKMWWVAKKLNLEAIEQALIYFKGRHDFTTFRATQCQAQSPIKTITDFQISRHEDQIWFDVTAPSFLHHQVRNMVGSLKWVGEGKWNPDQIYKALCAKSRSAGGPTAPACGLYLKSVKFYL